MPKRRHWTSIVPAFFASAPARTGLEPATRNQEFLFMSRHARVLHLLCLVLAIALLASCSGKKRASPVPVAAPGEIADLRNFPQDLNAYAKGSR